MGSDTTMLGQRASATSASTANCARPVSHSSSTTCNRLDRFVTCSGIPAWRRLIDCPLATDERVSLITAIFSDPDEIEVVKGLCGNDAQSFVDVVDEVLIPLLSQKSEPAKLEFSRPVE